MINSAHEQWLDLALKGETMPIGSVLPLLNPVRDSELWAMEATRQGRKLSDDSLFELKLLKSGTGIPVILSKGFLSEHAASWGGFERMVTERYPDSPVYRVLWKAMRKSDIPHFINLPRVLVKYDPWTEARKHAEAAGRALAAIIKQAAPQQFVLLGHSLGARVMAFAAKKLADVSEQHPLLETVHLTGAAISQDQNWHSLPKAVTGSIYNYYSSHDDILGYLYGATRLYLTNAVGLAGFIEKDPKIVNIDCSSFIMDHQDYFAKLHLAPGI